MRFLKSCKIAAA